MATVLITGGTGLIGKKLTELLSLRGYEVIILTRSKKLPGSKAGTAPNISYARWDVKKHMLDEDAIMKADHIIHLAGAGIADRRWTAKRKQELRDSRTESSALLIQYLKNTSNHVSSVISASAIGWYGEDELQADNRSFSENDPAAKSFLGETCRLWEESITPVELLGKRLVKLRTGIVLSNEGGVLAEFKKPVRFGIASILGSGKQIISWIHIDDICRMYVFAIENSILQGVFNAVAPAPVSNKDLVLKMAAKLKHKTFIPFHVPPFILKIMLGEMSIELLKSTTVNNDKIRNKGFRFLYPSLDAALAAL